ncbi:UNVERIFIED_CONTAM: hypothetical protein H355_003197 [Colinus virginianus]|nr:hypothetical protein H355_003197 [Colinus virginianus]
MARDSVVGNVAQDLGLSPSQLAARKARVVSEGSEQRFRLDPRSGVLTLTETLDREHICPHSESCTLFFQLLLENPVQLIRGEVDVRDVNDNSPEFRKKDILLKILETASPGSRFPLETARDKDRQLDREEHRELRLVLTATDGGSPPRSGTAEVRVVVLDANDNMPVFSREVYEVRVAENSPPGQLLVRVSATDPDDGSYGKVRYTFTEMSELPDELFDLNVFTGEILLSGNLDFEESQYHEIQVKATDGGGLSAHSRVHVEVLDVNDNAPEITLSSVRRARRREPGTLPTFPQSAADSGAGSLPRSYVYDVRLAAGTVDSEFRFLGPLFPCFPAGLPQGGADQRSSLCSAGLGQQEGDWAAQVYFCDLMCVQMEILNHKETSDLMVTLNHYQKLCGPFASLSGTYNLWKIYDGCTLKWNGDLNVSCGLNGNGDLNEACCLLNFLQGLNCELCSYGHPTFYVYYHYSI